jgi:hypothetical protein
MALVQGDTGGAMGKFFGVAEDMFGVGVADVRGKRLKSSSADVVMFSGCKDDQTVSCLLLLREIGRGTERKSARDRGKEWERERGRSGNEAE